MWCTNTATRHTAQMTGSLRNCVRICDFIVLSPAIATHGHCRTAALTARCGVVAVFKCVTLKTVHGRRVFHTWPLIEQLVASKQVDVSKIVSHRLPMTRYEEAYKARRP